MLRTAGVLLAALATTNAACNPGQKFDDETGFNCAIQSNLNTPSPKLLTQRSEDGKNNLVFIVEDGAKVGMQVGDGEQMYFNDFQADIAKVGEGNVNAIGLGVDIGKSWVNNFTKDLINTASKVPALEVKVELMDRIEDMKANVNFEVQKVTSACAINQFESKAASGTTPSSYSPPVCNALKTCSSTEFESKGPTPNSNRVCTTHKSCGSTEFMAMAGTAVTNTVCTKLTTCATAEVEAKKPTSTTDRICRPAERATCHTFAGQGEGKQSVISLDPKNKDKGAKINAFCMNDGTYLGGDGSSSLAAGRSCGTIRRRFEATADKAYWVFMNDTNAPTQVYCDMNSCGNDAAINQNPKWGNRRKDFINCGGWSMTFKFVGTDRCSGNGNNGARDCYYFGRRNTANLKWGKVFGSHTSISLENAMSPSYSRQSFSDVMFRSISSGWRSTQDASTRKWQSVGWRHPWTAKSVMEIAQGCRPLHDGELLMPPGSTVSNNVRHHIGMGINWNSRSIGDHYMLENPRSRFGFFGHDEGSCANNQDVVGCQFEWSGHSRHFIGMHLGNNNPDRPGGQNNYRITSFGVGAGYCGAGGGVDRYSATGHWWGHGSSNMQVRTSAIFVRDKGDMF